MKLYYLIILSLLLSCSSKKSKVGIDLNQNEVTTIKTHIPPPLKIGPTKDATIKGFEDQTEKLGLANIKATNIYAVDYNNDGFTDLVVLPEHYSVPEFYRFEISNSSFVKEKEFPFPEIIRASFMSFIDIDKDGVLDVVLGILNQKTELTRYPTRFYKGKVKEGKVSYQRVSSGLGEGIRPTSSIVFLDFDLDGKLDIFEANWYSKENGRPSPHYNQLFKGEGFKFLNASGFLDGETEFSRDLNAYVNARPTFGVSTCDIDQNGFPDILTSNSGGYKNRLWLNIRHPNQKGNRFFKDYGEPSTFASDFDGQHSPRGGGNSFYSLCSDYNNDGIMDIIVGELTHSYDTENRDRSAFLTGTTKKFPPKFMRTEYHSDDGKGSWDQGDRRGVMIDYDIDGFVDVVVENTGFPPTSRLILFRQEENHAYVDLAESLGINILNPSGIVVADINKDGLPDIITGQSKIRNSKIDSRLYAFVNVSDRKKKTSFKFHLNGKKSNIMGIGSMVILKTNNRLMRKWNETIYGPLPSQNEYGVHFGIGEDRALSVEVKWPFLQTSKNGNKTQIVRKYSLKKFGMKKHYELTLCENGKILEGKRDCYIK